MIEDLTKDEILALDQCTCPDCGHPEFLEGPRGGLAINIKCPNCGAKFCIVPGIPGPFGKSRIGRPKNE